MKKTYKTTISTTIDFDKIIKSHHLTTNSNHTACEDAIFAYAANLSEQDSNCLLDNAGVIIDDLCVYLQTTAPHRIRVVKFNDEYIEFDDGTRITYDHDQDCCENNYADFEQLRDTGLEQETFKTPLIFEARKYGFHFGNPGKMYFVPCYSEQNGYYSTDVDIYYNDDRVLELDGKFIEG